MKLFTVGPVEMYETTLKTAGQQLPYFRTSEFSEVMFQIDSLIKKFSYAPIDAKTIYLTASGTGAMEAAVINCFDSHDKLLIISGGSFGKRFEQICQLYEIPYEAIRLSFGETLTAGLLAGYSGKGFTGLLVNIHETSIGQLYPIKEISDFCRSNNMYLIVDAISSFLADEYDISRFSIDATIFSSQKALALSPGISVVILSDRIYKEKVQNINCRSMYFNFKDYVKDMERGQTPFTPAVGILLEMLDMLLMIEKQGLNNKIAYTHNLAVDFREKVLSAGYKIPQFPLSNAVTPLIFDGNAKTVYNILKNQFDITITPSGGNLENILLRVGHIGNLTIADNDYLIQALKQISG